MLPKTQDYITRAYTMSCSHGFHEGGCSRDNVGHYLMLVLCELSEAVEADRNGRHADLSKLDIAIDGSSSYKELFSRYVKDTVEDELADVCIRLYDLAGLCALTTVESLGGDVDMSDEFSQYYSGSSFVETAYILAGLLSLPSVKAEVEISEVIGASLTFVEEWCKTLGIPLAEHIEAKMQYNSFREYKHGKRY